MFAFAKLVVLSVALVGAVNGATHSARHRRHAGTNFLQRDDSSMHTFEKRFDNARMTFYEAGLGACGKYNNDGDYIVALNSAQFAGGSHCGETITITYQGKTASAQIMDECPGCPYAGLDLTPGLFSHFASQDAGVIYGDWNFGSGGGEESKPSPTTTKASPTPQPKTTKTPDPTPTPTPTPSSSTEEKKTTSSFADTSSSFSSSSSSESSSSASSSSAAESSSSSVSSSSSPSSTSASASASPSANTPTGSIDSFSNAFVQLVLLAVAGAESH